MLLIIVSIVGFIMLGAVAAYLLMNKPELTVADRLHQLRMPTSGEEDDEDRQEKESQAAEIARKVAQDINKFAPVSASEAKKIQQTMLHAGYRSAHAVLIFRAIQLLSLIVFPGTVALVLFIIGQPLDEALIYIGAGLIAGFLLPKTILNYIVSSRQEKLRCGLADALDLLVVSVEAGLGLNAALIRVSDEMKAIHPEISEEFGLVNTEIRVGRQREEALRNLAERSGVEDLRSLCAMLIQTDRFGTSIARAIRVYSDALRTKRRQRAEQTAQKAAVKMLFPLAVFLFPTLFIILLGPAALQLSETFK